MASSASPSALQFGPFRLSRARKLLLHGDRPVRLGSRALAILVALAERASEVVSREELAAIVWPNTVVEESSLRVHVAALRKALGDGQGGARYIINAPGRGYCFVAPVRHVADHAQAVNSLKAEFYAHSDHRLPPRVAGMVGRDDDVPRVVTALTNRRLVTLVGPGGVGKTALAVEVAHLLADQYEGGAVFVDLASIRDASLVPASIAVRLGISHQAADPMLVLEDYLRGRELLLVLDNCEHVISGAALIAERLVGLASRLRVLATSREALRVAAEVAYRVSALAYPQDSQVVDATGATLFASIRLFTERAIASSDSFALTEHNVEHVSKICRWLDGNPFAIELVAARIDIFGAQEVAQWLDARLLTHPQARRSAEPRHQTLASMLDWSYDLLSADEQIVFRRLSAFRSRFPLPAAVQVVCDDKLATDKALNAILSLVGKSLVATDVRTDTVQYELPGLTRAYATELLANSGESEAIRHRHAFQMLELLREAEDGWLTIDKARWIAEYAHTMDDVLGAVDWALERPAEVQLGIDLLVLGWTVGIQLSRFAEFESLATRALAALGRAPADPARELPLHNIMISLIESQHGPSPRLAHHVARAEALACAGAGLWSRIDPEILGFVRVWTKGDYDGMVSQAEKIGVVARSSRDPVAILVSDRCLAQASHFSGEHARSLVLCERVLGHPVRRGPLRSVTATLDHSVSMRIILARIHWLQGRPDDACAVAKDAIELARTDTPQGLCLALAFAACPIALWSGMLEWAVQLVTMLTDQAASQTMLALWTPWARSLHELLNVRLGHPPVGPTAELINSASRYGDLLVDHLLTVDGMLPGVEPLASTRGKTSGWCASELRRAQGERLLRSRANRQTQLAAEALFLQACEIAKRQGALAWELRACTSLARLRHMQGRDSEAYFLLLPVYERFLQGRSTADLVSAKALLTKVADGS